MLLARCPLLLVRLTYRGWLDRIGLVRAPGAGGEGAWQSVRRRRSGRTSSGLPGGSRPPPVEPRPLSLSYPSMFLRSSNPSAARSAQHRGAPQMHAYRWISASRAFCFPLHSSVSKTRVSTLVTAPAKASSPRATALAPSGVLAAAKASPNPLAIANAALPALDWMPRIEPALIESSCASLSTTGSAA